jgi:hypothetical protein
MASSVRFRFIFSKMTQSSDYQFSQPPIAFNSSLLNSLLQQSNSTKFTPTNITPDLQIAQILDVLDNFAIRLQKTHEENMTFIAATKALLTSHNMYATQANLSSLIVQNSYLKDNNNSNINSSSNKRSRPSTSPTRVSGSRISRYPDHVCRDFNVDNCSRVSPPCKFDHICPIHNMPHKFKDCQGKPV